ncbi:ComEA family DNA-binding protein [Pseudomonas sp. RP23018S]|uniref:ComEA family DNA-binding protein n=1 Tax=Pseudomonas sp. RP23018S TaxID=3096037 RepID=UPI002ACA1BD1|nr:ComEA family DNA-binding protein [Pseudomonas sp. RP23018S]MDZ5602124.1 ComEA family DNA-binding protein [Pseudomonas sp. RP23018S]
MRKSFFAPLIPLAAGLLFSLGATANSLPADATAPKLASELSTSSDMPGHANEVTTPLDLNTADAATLQKELAGIGKAKAEAIVAYREAQGPFTSVDELLEIKGIGSALLERNRDKISVK